LTVVDANTCEALSIDVEPGINCERVVETMSRITAKRGSPKTIRVDNGPEFISKALALWAYANGVSFNGRLRDDCLNANSFLSLDDARSKIEAWRRDYFKRA
jgi:putative transposase